MKVFISQAMNGRSEEEILNEREKVVKILEIIKDTLKRRSRAEDDSIEILDTYFTDDEPEGVKQSGIYWLGKSMELLSQADICIFINKHYEKFRGCYLEYLVCEKYFIPIYELEF